MAQQVSGISIIGMVFSLVISIGGPVALFFIWKKRTGADWRWALIGAGVFVVFVFGLESPFHNMVLGAAGESITGNIWIYALYAGLAAGLFEETGRLLAIRLFLRKTLNRENAMMYGIGHGGIEAILLVGISTISNLTASLSINAGQLETLLQGMDGAARETALSQLSRLWTLEPVLFFMGGVERVTALALHLALSYLVYRCVKDHRIGYYFLSVALHALVDAGTVLLQAVVPLVVLEASLLAAVAALWFFLARFYRAEKAAQTAQ